MLDLGTWSGFMAQEVVHAPVVSALDQTSFRAKTVPRSVRETEALNLKPAPPTLNSAMLECNMRWVGFHEAYPQPRNVHRGISRM